MQLFTLQRVMVTAAIVVASLAATASVAMQPDAPDSIDVPRPHHGDTAGIGDAVLTVRENETVLLHDGSYAVGTAVRVQELGNESWSEAFYVAGEQIAQRTMVRAQETDARWRMLDDPEEVEVDTRTDAYTLVDEATLCGVYHGLQGMTLRAGLVVEAAGLCGGTSEFRVQDVVARDGLLVARVDEVLQNGSVRPVELVDGVPYPLHWTDPLAEGALTGYERGRVAAPPSGVLPAALEWRRGASTPMDLSGVEFSYSFQDAWDDAMLAPEGLSFRLFMQTHPDAYVAQAEAGRSVNNDATWTHWDWVVTDGSGGMRVLANKAEYGKTEPADGLAPAPGIVFVRSEESSGRWPAPEAVPALPGAADLLGLAESLGRPHSVASLPLVQWKVSCGDACDEPTSSFGGRWVEFDVRFQATRDVESVEKAVLAATGQGRTLQSVHAYDAAWGTPLSPSAHAATLPVAPTALPSGGLAAGLGLAGLAAAGVYLFWPVLKHLPLLGLFSRIPRRKALDNPARQELYDLVSAEPGIHFQELARRLGRGQGTTSHHMDHLVKSGLVVRRRGRGFTCYFPKGTDRAVVAGAEVTKSDVARALLEAAHRHPGITAAEVAREVGVSQATTSYHVQRLAKAGLVDRRPDGKKVRLFVPPSASVAVQAPVPA